MSEATQTKISEDLRRLAENVGKWPPDSYWGAWLSAREGQAEYTGFFGWPESMLPTHTPAYTKEEWAAARKALGFDAEEWPEDRIDLVSLNGATGDHYGEEGRADRAQKGQEPGKILGLPEQGQKHDSEKPRMDLIPPLMELEVARVLAFGAEKYGPDNWRQVPELRRRYIAAAKRHINAIQQGFMLDEETGLHHAAHAVCCLMFLGEVEIERGEP